MLFFLLVLGEWELFYIFGDVGKFLCMLEGIVCLDVFVMCDGVLKILFVVGIDRVMCDKVEIIFFWIELNEIFLKGLVIDVIIRLLFVDGDLVFVFVIFK